MCKLLTITKTKGPNKEAETLLRLQFEELRTQRDGCAGLTIDFNNKVKVYRSLKDYDEVFQAVLKDLPTSRLVSIHTRIGTSGVKSLDNVHFFKPRDWYFAHNGFVPQYTEHTGIDYHWNVESTSVSQMVLPVSDEPTSFTEAVGEMAQCKGCNSAKRGYCRIHEHLVKEIKAQEESKAVNKKTHFCDSYQFVDNLPKKVSTDTIINHMADTDFVGMGLLVNANGKDIYMLIAKDCYAVTDKKTFAGFFSYEPELKASVATEVNLCGITIEGKKTTIGVTEKAVEIKKGVYRLRPEQIKN